MDYESLSVKRCGVPIISDALILLFMHCGRMMLHGCNELYALCPQIGLLFYFIYFLRQNEYYDCASVSNHEHSPDV